MMKNKQYLELQSITDPLEGVTLIEAAAGTGKTYNIQNLVARLIVEKNYPVESIAVVTFTDAAAKELSDRLRVVLESLAMELHGQCFSDCEQQQRAAELIEAFKSQGISTDDIMSRVNTALRDFDNNWVSTIHSFCSRILNENAFESSVVFHTRLEKNIAGFVEKLLTDYRRINRYRKRSLPEPSEKAVAQFSRDWLSAMGRHGLQREMGGIYFENSEELFHAQDEVIEAIQALPVNESIGAIGNFDGKLNKIDGMDQDTFITEYTRKLEVLLEATGQERDYRLWADVCGKLSADFLSEKSSKRSEKILKITTDYIASHSFFNLAQQYKDISESAVLCWKLEAGRFIARELDSWKARENFQGFDDLLLRVNDALQHGNLKAVLQKRFNAGIIDEFQDTDPVQYNIFKEIFIDGRQDTVFFMVGDPRQAIYSFRGGDMATYMQARRECLAHPQGSIYKLSRNFRSSWPMVDAFNVFFDHQDFFATDQITVGETLKAPADKNVLYKRVNDDLQNIAEEAFEVLDYPLQIKNLAGSECNVYINCADEIVHLLNSDTFRIRRKEDQKLERINPGDIAVLAFFNFELETIRRELIKRNVPVVCERKQGIWSSNEAAGLAIFMQGVLENNSETLCREALLSDLGGLTLNDLDNAESENDNFQAMRRRMMKQLNECWHQSGTAAFIEQACKLDMGNTGLSFRGRMALKSNGERVIANYTQLCDLLSSAELEGSLSPRGVWNYLNENIIRGQNEGEFAENLESDHPAVKLMTIHKSKGLQFPIVFLPGISSNYPLCSAGMKIYHRNDKSCYNPDGRVPEANSIASVEELQEQLRLIYVAITRACSGCFVTWSGSKYGNSAMDWVLRMKAAVMEDHAHTVRHFADKKFPLNERPAVVVPGKLENTCHLPIGFSGTYIHADNTDHIVPPPVVETVKDQWRLLSYSSLGMEAQDFYSRKNDDEISGIDRDGSDDETLSLSGNINENAVANHLTGGVWSIPGGAAIGNAWHKLLEVMDFTRPVDPLEVERILRMYDLSEQSYIEGSCRMLENLMEYQLPCGMKFKQLTNDKKVNEFEFLLSSCHGVDLGKLLDAVNPYLQKKFNAVYPLTHQLKTTGGFFNGFIDMIFEHEQRYYIVDWKSNKLASQADAFSGEKLNCAMFNASYPIQYLCYTAALVRHLEHQLDVTINEALYEQYIGGVYYIFLRGMSLEHPAGVFCDRVPFQTIQALLEVIN